VHQQRGRDACAALTAARLVRLREHVKKQKVKRACAQAVDVARDSELVYYLATSTEHGACVSTNAVVGPMLALQNTLSITGDTDDSQNQNKKRHKTEAAYSA